MDNCEEQQPATQRAPFVERDRSNLGVATAMESSVMARLQERGCGTKSALMYLQEVRTILSSEGRWIKGQLARDVRNAPCKPSDVSACEFSLQGALESVQDSLSPEWAKAQDLLKKYADGDLRKWNDRWWRSHKSVLRAIDLAMRAAL